MRVRTSLSGSIAAMTTRRISDCHFYWTIFTVDHEQHEASSLHKMYRMGWGWGVVVSVV